MAETKKVYRKSFIPLESNPEVFTKLINLLGVRLAFHDVFSLEPELLAFVPRPAYALVLVFPTSEAREQALAADEATRQPYEGSGADEKVVWYSQTIYNACGLYGILHAVSNGTAREYIDEGSLMAKLLETCVPLKPQERAFALEDSAELEAAYKTVASTGDSVAPENPEDVVDYHYVCFVKSSRDGHLWELDGDRKGPVDRGAMDEDEDVLGESGLRIVKEFIEREQGQNTGFSLLALGPQ